EPRSRRSTAGAPRRVARPQARARIRGVRRLSAFRGRAARAPAGHCRGRRLDGSRGRRTTGERWRRHADGGGGDPQRRDAATLAARRRCLPPRLHRLGRVRRVGRRSGDRLAPGPGRADRVRAHRSDGPRALDVAARGRRAGAARERSGDRRAGGGVPRAEVLRQVDAGDRDDVRRRVAHHRRHARGVPRRAGRVHPRRAQRAPPQPVGRALPPHARREPHGDVAWARRGRAAGVDADARSRAARRALPPQPGGAARGDGRRAPRAAGPDARRIRRAAARAHGRAVPRRGGGHELRPGDGRGARDAGVHARRGARPRSGRRGGRADRELAPRADARV
ncbi:MAG: hypothetical protein AVDCRST_MAG40-1779, partial [uncultured Gemmatimonadaceae bacterium]